MYYIVVDFLEVKTGKITIAIKAFYLCTKDMWYKHTESFISLEEVLVKKASIRDSCMALYIIYNPVFCHNNATYYKYRQGKERTSICESC